MDSASIKKLLSGSAVSMIENIQCFDEIDSTNEEALRQLRSGESESGLLVANCQSAGRGRRGRVWLSPDQAGLYISFFRKFDLPVDSLQALSLLTALSLESALREAGVQGLQLKWPNDLLHAKKKLAGILLELHRKEEGSYLVFGIGINISLPAEVIQKIDRPVTDLSSIAAQLPQNNVLVAAIINKLCDSLTRFEAEGFKPFREVWNRLDCYLDCDIVIENAATKTMGRSLGVDESGALILKTASGERLISSGEIFPSLREVVS